jgi:cytochrome P450
MVFSQIEGWPRALYETDTYQVPLPGGPLFVMSPEAVRTVLQERAEDFSTGALFRRVMRPAWGRGLLVAERQEWRAQRHAAAGAFRPADMASLAPFFAAAAARTLKKWAAASAGVIDVHREMAQLTFEVILDTTLSGGEDFDRAAMRAAIDRLFSRIGRVPITALLFPDRHHEGRPSRHAPERGLLLAMIGPMIRRRRSAPPVGDLVDLLMAARDPATGESMDEDLLADNLLGFIVAGHETTTLALTWALFLAASHRGTAERLRDEVAKVAGQEPIGRDEVGQLRFARQVISEAMRLYPPAFLLTRVAQREVEVGGHCVRAGQRVNVPVYAIHRRAAHFQEPHAFNPDRFSQDRPQPSRFSYLPFGAGPRICLGASFAMTEAVCVLATLMRAVDFKLVAPERVWPVARLSLLPKDGLQMLVTVRKPFQGTEHSS